MTYYLHSRALFIGGKQHVRYELHEECRAQCYAAVVAVMPQAGPRNDGLEYGRAKPQAARKWALGWLCEHTHLGSDAKVTDANRSGRTWELGARGGMREVR